VPSCQERRFSGDVRQAAELGREPVAPGCNACHLLSEGDDRIPSKGRQPFVPSEVREEPRVGAHALLVARDRGREVRQHLEQLSAVRVMCVEQSVERRVDEQNHLDIDVFGIIDGLARAAHGSAPARPVPRRVAPAWTGTKAR
jgi:hypothetical protein